MSLRSLLALHLIPSDSFKPIPSEWCTNLTSTKCLLQFKMPFLICVAFVTRHSNGYVYFWERFISINSCIKITCYNNYDYTWRFEFQCCSFPSSDDIFFPEKSSCFLEGPINSLNEKKSRFKTNSACCQRKIFGGIYFSHTVIMCIARLYISAAFIFVTCSPTTAVLR